MKSLSASRRTLVALAVVLMALLLASGAYAQPVPAAPAEAEAVSWWAMPRWSPYIVGAGIGLLAILTFLLSDHPIGVSTAIAKTAGMIEKLFRGKKVEDKEYYRENPPTIDWGWLFVGGLLIGAILSAQLSGDFRFEWVPPVWAEGTGFGVAARMIVALIGGVCLGFGARWGSGCTSGHGISGALQLVVASWISLVCFFVGGIAAAMFIYRVLA